MPCGVPNTRSKTPAYCGSALFEELEDTAAVVVGHDDGEIARPRLTGPDQQPGRVVQEGQVAHERDGPAALVRQRGAHRRRDGAVDTCDAAIRQHPHGGLGIAHECRVANRVGCAEQKLVAVRESIHHSSCHVQAGGLGVGRRVACGRQFRRVRSSAAHRAIQAGSGVPVTTALVPVASTLPDTSGQRGPVVSA